jgi:hypothetical protein
VIICLLIFFCSSASAYYLDKLPDKNYELVGRVSVTVAANSNYCHYVNDRYGFTIDFPSFFSLGYLSGNSDGIFVTIKNGNASLSASGCHNYGQSLNDCYSDYIGHVKSEFGLKPSYIAKGTDWFVLSWKINGTIYYKKVFVCDEYVNSFILEFLSEDKDAYNDIVTNIEQSFVPGWRSGNKICD